LENLRAGEVLVVWKLDRLGRSLKHLIEVVNELMTRKIGLKSLNDPIDTTTPQGQLTLRPHRRRNDIPDKPLRCGHRPR
jgi:DNA invertase Pin-like site-specific DNA recombinase